MPSHAQLSGSRRWHAAAVAVAVATFGLSAAAPAQAVVDGDAKPESTWHVNGSVYASVIVGDTVFVGGSFTKAVGPNGRSVRRTNLAAFSLSTGKPRAWRPTAPGAVRALVSDGTSVWIGGDLRPKRLAPYRILKVSAATGTVDSRFRASTDAPVTALALQAGALYVGGSFHKVNKQARSRVAKVRAATGSVIKAFTTRADGSVLAIVPSPVSGDVFLGGSFFTVNGDTHHAVAAVDGTTGAVRSTVFALAATTRGLDISPDGRLLYGATGGEINSASAWSTSSGARMFRVQADGPVRAVRYVDGNVYFGFSQGIAGNLNQKLLAMDAFNGTVDASFRPVIPGYWGVLTISAADSGIVAGGRFLTVAGQATRGFAVFRADLPPHTTLVGGMTGWRYLDNGTRPAGWETEGFDDSAWGTGLPQFGYGDGGEETVVHSGPDTLTYYTTSYYRTTFDLSEVPGSLTLALAADDGAVAYLNGVEVVRDNMPTGPIDNDTRATTWRGTSAEDLLREFGVDPQLLHAGTNTLAVELHQANGGLVDASFDARLTARP